MIGELPPEGRETDIVWTPLDADSAKIEELSWEIIQLQAKTETGFSQDGQSD